jgi:hypothetical protein
MLVVLTEASENRSDKDSNALENSSPSLLNIGSPHGFPKWVPVHIESSTVTSLSANEQGEAHTGHMPGSNIKGTRAIRRRPPSG